ncbi:early nodulin-75-like [Hippoglossus hippoglossus]|uniref:early nodulin-75-like n=1 Tax=Hippoglossus hippoglossus TaxID=8267 RepID=UPI00148B7047|nr:early nodulin-75-like [Hippoglossus hippoglossus]
MPFRNDMLFFIVTATLASLKGFNGQAVDLGALPVLQGRLHFRSVVSDDGQHGSALPTRYGSLTLSPKGGDEKLAPVSHSLMAAKLKRLDPSVQCSDNLMTLKVKRIGAPHILVNSGVGPLTPLPRMPSSCGSSVKRSRRHVAFAAPYQGCHVTQQGGDYVLPLRLWGKPMTMSCPAVLPPPSVSCFPTGMVVKFGGIAAYELKVKISGAWVYLSSVCDSCGIAVDSLPGGLTLTAPYNRGLCIENKDEEYFLSLLLLDVELLVTCPSLPEIKPTTSTTSPPSDSSPVWQFPHFHQFPQYPQFPMFPHKPVFPVPTPPAHTPAPTPSTVAPPPQWLQFPSGPAQYYKWPPYNFFPRTVPPTQSIPNKNPAATPETDLPQMPHSQYDWKPDPQFPLPPQYHFLPYPKLPEPHEGQHQTLPNPKPVNHQPKPQPLHPQIYQVPVLYPPPRYPPQRPTTPTAAPATAAANTLKPADQKPFYAPHPYMQYYAPQQAPIPVFPDPATTPHTNSAPFGQQPVHYAVPPYYYFPPHQKPPKTK